MSYLLVEFSGRIFESFITERLLGSLSIAKVSYILDVKSLGQIAARTRAETISPFEIRNFFIKFNCYIFPICTTAAPWCHSGTLGSRTD